MTVTEYPAYVAGQTLTADELNLLSEYAFERDRLVGRLIGFGVNCGFSGSFSGSTLTIKAGLACDQSGEPLVKRDVTTISFPAAAPDLVTTPYGFLDSTPGVWSVVARAADTEEAHPPCTADGCDGHSIKHLRAVVIEVVAGRLTNDRLNFANHDVLKIVPLTLTPQGQPIGDIDHFKSQLIAVLNTLGSTISALSSKVAAVSVSTTESAAIRGYKVGWLNTALMATIDLVRCQALNAVACFRDETHPGVVLGAVTNSGSTWTFDCSYKHFWEPPTGLSQALLGGSCQSVCGLSQSYLASVLNGYAPPDPPAAPTGTGTGGGGVVLHPPIKYCREGLFKCGVIVYPPYKIPGLWPPSKVPIPTGPDDYFPNWDLTKDPDIRIRDGLTDVYGIDKINALDDGVFVGNTLIGQYGANVKATIEDAVTSRGGTPTVTVLSQQEFDTSLATNQLDSFHPGTSFSGSDHVMVVTDAAGLVTGMGVIAGMVAVRQAGPIAQVAQSAQVSATQASARVDTFQVTFDTGMSSITGGLNNLEMSVKSLHEDVGLIKGGVGDAAVTAQRLDQIEEHLGKSDALSDRVSKLEGRALAQVGDLGTKTYTVDVGNTLAEFAQTAVAALKTIDAPRNKNLPQYIDAVEIKQSQLELAVRAGDPGVVASSTVELLDSMRTMIGGASVDAAAKRQLDAQFRAMKGMLG